MSDTIAGIILASGMSRRFGAQSKLLVPLAGAPLVLRVAQSYVRAGLKPALVVVGPDAAAIGEALRSLPVEIIINPDYELGQSRALVRGIAALGETVRAAVVGPADQPLLEPSTIRSLVDAYAVSGAPIVAPLFDGMRGTPILFDRSVFPALLEVSGDAGGRSVLRERQDDVQWVPIAEPEQAMDIDTPEDLARARALLEDQLA